MLKLILSKVTDHEKAHTIKYVNCLKNNLLKKIEQITHVFELSNKIYFFVICDLLELMN